MGERNITALDGLRTVAIGLVLVTHAAKPAIWPGGYGVDVFFVLSGFLITTLLWRDQESLGRIRLGRFYLRRAIRLFPALITMLLASLVFGILLTGDVGRMVGETISAVLYLTPFTDALAGPPLFYGHLWTLAMEEYFYLIWPLVLIVLLKLGAKWQHLVTFLLAVAVALYGMRAAAEFIIGSELHPPRVGGIAIGCALALVVLHTKARGNGTLLALLGTAGLVLAWITSSSVVDTFTPLIAALATVAIILAIIGPTRTLLQRVLEVRALVIGGQISYDLYLWHVPVLIGVAMLTDLPRDQVWWWAYPIAIAISAASLYWWLPVQNRMRAAVDAKLAARAEQRV
jgi:peptidoglycan/LPS O-acetylase OafA/YrhL